MTNEDVNLLAEQNLITRDELQVLHAKYPSARKGLVQQVLAYAKKHGMSFSYVINLMEMEDELLAFFGITNEEESRLYNTISG